MHHQPRHIHEKAVAIPVRDNCFVFLCWHAVVPVCDISAEMSSRDAACFGVSGCGCGTHISNLSLVFSLSPSLLDKYIRYVKSIVHRMDTRSSVTGRSTTQTHSSDPCRRIRLQIHLALENQISTTPQPMSRPNSMDHAFAHRPCATDRTVLSGIQSALPYCLSRQDPHAAAMYCPRALWVGETMY